MGKAKSLALADAVADALAKASPQDKVVSPSFREPREQPEGRSGGLGRVNELGGPHVQLPLAGGHVFEWQEMRLLGARRRLPEGSWGVSFR